MEASEPSPGHWITRSRLAADLAALGIAAGDIVMVHAACGRVGQVLGGPDTIIAALRDAVAPDGTVMAYLAWDSPWEDFDGGRVPDAWKPHVPPFDPALTRGARGNGVLPEMLRTTPGTRRSGNPGASIAALGAQAEWLTADHPLDYGYGPGTPLARLVEARGKVLMLGAPWDTMTLLHHAEHLARLPDKRLYRVEVPFPGTGGTVWRTIEEFDTGDPVVEGLPDNAIELMVTAYVESGGGRQGMVGEAPSLLVEAAAIVPFAVGWLEAAAG